MIKKNLSKGILDKWKDAYQETNRPNDTKNVLIEINELHSFLEGIKELNKGNKNAISAVRVYFVRQDDIKNLDGRFRNIVVDGHSQASIAMIPVINYSEHSYIDKNGKTNDFGGADDYFDNQDHILCLTPGNEKSKHEHSGLCPYNCGGSI